MEIILRTTSTYRATDLHTNAKRRSQSQPTGFGAMKTQVEEAMRNGTDVDGECTPSCIFISLDKIDMTIYTETEPCRHTDGGWTRAFT